MNVLTRSRLVTTAASAASLALVLTACGSDDNGGSDSGTENTSAEGGEIVLYSGRSEELVGPLVEQFEEATGITVNARYADTPELAAQLLAEGDQTPADVFLSQDAGALGALSHAGVLTDLPDELTSLVPSGFTSEDGSWVGVTGRARVITYDGDELSEDEVPGSVDELLDPEWSGRVGIAPTNASFQAFVTGYRVAQGEDGAADWLSGMVENDVQSYEKNGPILEAVNEGELDVGLINHYYWYERAAEGGAENMRAQLKFLDDGDPGALVNVTGAGILPTGADNPDAQEFISYLLSEEGQTYFVEKTFEYPLIDGIDAPEGLPELTSLQGPDIDLADLATLEETTLMISEVGLT